MTFKQHAEGAFKCFTQRNTPHCGKVDGEGNFRYSVDIQYTDQRALDRNGFLLDNLDFQTYFDGLGIVAASCEELAESACGYFMRRLGARCQWVKCIEVRVYPFGEVYVEAILQGAEFAV